MLRSARQLFHFVSLMLVASALSVVAAGQTVSLDHGWTLLLDQPGTLKIDTLPAKEASGWRVVRVGVSWNAQFDDMRDYSDAAWYRTDIDVPQFTAARAVLLQFGAVDYAAQVFVNGKPAGTHEGGYTPFEFDITSLVHPGPNDLVVRVVDLPTKPGGDGKLLYDEVPHGKQNWYVQTSGIWQPVQLQFRPVPYISQVHVTAGTDGKAKIDVAIAGAERSEATLVIRSNSGGIVERRTISVATPRSASELTLANPEIWSPTSPALYTAEVMLPSGDRYVTRFGLRSFEARGGKLYLNGQPFYMRAALDQDFYPDTIYSTPSQAYVADMMLKAKALGLNLLRCHIKVCPPEYLNAADEVGMLVWYEIPSWNDQHLFTDAAAERGEKIFREMFERDWNHPSIVISSIINESWGANLRNANEREWLKAAYGRAKALLGNRALVVDNSACCDNFHVKSDLDDFHQYYSIPDHAAQWDKWVSDFASRPKWTFSPHGDAERTWQEPLLVSEFGNWGLPQLPQKLPWWFDRDFGGREVTRPAGVLDRFQQYKFDRVFKDFNTLAEATQWHQYRALKYEIENMRSHASIQGYVVTELTDINWEVNGMMDMFRRPKSYATQLADVQRDNVLLLSPAKRSVTSGDPVAVKISVSSYRPADWKGARVVWSTTSGRAGSIAISAAPALGDVTQLGEISFVAPAVRNPQIDMLNASVISRSGELMAQTQLELYLYPREATASRGAVEVHDPAKQLAALTTQLRGAGYSVGKSNLLISSVWDETVEQHLRSGGRAVVVLNGKDSAAASAPFKIVARDGSDYDGNWVSNFNWVLPDSEIFKTAALRPILGFEAASVVPSFILQGISAEDYDKVLAGEFYGWLNDNSGTAMRVTLGKGEAIVTTFRFDAYRKDPFATRLLDSMIATARGASTATAQKSRAQSATTSGGKD